MLPRNARPSSSPQSVISFWTWNLVLGPTWKSTFITYFARQFNRLVFILLVSASLSAMVLVFSNCNIGGTSAFQPVPDGCSLEQLAWPYASDDFRRR